MTKKNIHVTPHKEGGWQVIKDGAGKAIKRTDTQKEAIDIATQIAKNQKTDTKIHGRDGKIIGGNSYGNDPCPPKDKK
ncbi:MAG: DUF2188 domain-containing protein [Candidatus Aminicenantes bacterium]|jgi:hypothetical protein|nr:DUF2188 domain-containing protein [Candidatus Aminicenantes bacterium]